MEVKICFNHIMQRKINKVSKSFAVKKFRINIRIEKKYISIGISLNNFHKVSM